MSLLTKGGIERLSELVIDADKDWQAYGITNLKGLAAAMGRGDLIVRGDDVLQKLPPGIAGYVLVSAGPLQIPAWSPVPSPADLYFPVWLYLRDPVAGSYAPDHLRELSAPITSPHDETTVATRTPVQALEAPVAALYTPDHAVAKGDAPESCFHTEVEATAILAATFGHNSPGANHASIADMIRGSRFMLMEDATAESIDAYIQVNDPTASGATVPCRCAIYSRDLVLLGFTDPVSIAAGSADWVHFSIPIPFGLAGRREYWVLAWAEDVMDMEVLFFYDSAADCTIAIDQGLHLPVPYTIYPDSLTGHSREQTKFSIYCNVS